MKMRYKIIFSFVLILTLVFAVPGGYRNVYAAPLEDCDLDGYDDATGVPVPWPGYDETKGDTPDGPGGSKTPAATPTPAGTDSTGTGNSNTEASGKANSEDSDKADSGKSGNSSDTNSGKTGSTKPETTNNENSGKTGKTDSGKTDSTVKDKTSSGTTAKAGSSTAGTVQGQGDSGKTGNAASGKADNTKADNTGITDSGKTSNTDSGSGTVQENTGEAEDGQTNTASGETESTEAGNTGSLISGEENSQAESPQTEIEPAEANSDNGNTVNTDTSADEIEAVINTKGSLEITEATGSIIHAGGLVVISGSGFAGDIANLEIEIQSESRQLGIVESSGSGAFEAQFSIPEDLEAGLHHIVVLYQGKEITRQQVEIGPKAADSFLQALSVGFTKDNKGLIPGLLILLVLFAAGAGALGVNVLFRFSRNKS